LIEGYWSTIAPAHILEGSGIKVVVRKKIPKGGKGCLKKNV